MGSFSADLNWHYRPICKEISMPKEIIKFLEINTLKVNLLAHFVEVFSIAFYYPFA